MTVVKMLWLFAIEANEIVKRFLGEQVPLQSNEGEIVPGGEMFPHLFNANLSFRIDLERDSASHPISGPT